MSKNEPQATEAMGQTTRPATPVRNPYIMNFCKVLVEKKGDPVEPEALKKLLEDMYNLFECMLGQNMIDELPEHLRKEYLAATEDLSKLSYEKIGEIFDKNVPNHERVMKNTMKQFAEIYMRNASFNPEDYPVPVQTCTT